MPDMDFFGDSKPWPTIPIPHTALRGPADAEQFRTELPGSRTRWYLDPLPGDAVWDEDDHGNHYPAISTVKKAVGQDWTLVGLKRAAEATIQKIDRFVGMDFTDIYEAFKGDNERGLRHASQRGTNVHTYFEMGLRGRDITYVDGPHEPGANYLPAVRDFFITYKPTLIAAEYVSFHRTLNGKGYAGTGDAIVELTDPKGKRVVAAIDWKSRKDEGKHACYPQEAAQVAANAKAQYMIIEGPNGAARAELPKCDLGLIVSIRPDGARCYPIDLEEGFNHWTELHRWWIARKTERKSIGRVWPAPKPTSLLDQLGMTTSREEAVLLWKLHKDGGLWTEEHTAAMAAKWS